jgi:hypothetical protein
MAKRTISIKARLQADTKGFEKAEKSSKNTAKHMRDQARASERIKENMKHTGSKTAKTGMSRTEYLGTRSTVGTGRSAAKNFSGMAQAGGMTSGFVAAYATLAANIFALTAAFQALSDAAKVQQLTQGLELMGARGGVALKVTADGLREVTNNAISTADAMRSVAQASSAGLGSEEIERLGRVAQGAALALGRDTSEAMDRLTRGAIKLEPELLDELGIMVRLDEAVKEYAAANGIAASSVTLTQKRQAFLNAVLAEGERKFGDINEQIDSNPYDKLSASVRDFGTDVMKIINGALVPFIKVLTETPSLGLVLALGILKQSFSKVLPSMEKTYMASVNRMEAYRASAGALKPDIADAKRQKDLLTGADQVKAQREYNNLVTRQKNVEALIAIEKKKQAAYEAYRSNLAKGNVITARKEYLLTLATLSAEEKRVQAQAKMNVLTSVRLALSGVGAALTMVVGVLSTVMTVLAIGYALFAGIKALYKYLNPPTEAQKRLEAQNEKLKEITESAEKTREQLDKLSVGEATDALANSTLDLITAQKRVLELEKQIARESALAFEARAKRIRLAHEEYKLAQLMVDLRSAEDKALDTSAIEQQIVAQENVVASFEAQMQSAADKVAAIKFFKDEDKSIQLIYQGVKDLVPEQAALVDQAIREGKSREEIVALLYAAEPAVRRLQNINKDLAESTRQISEGFRDLRLKDLDTNFTEIAGSVGSIMSRFDQLTMAGQDTSRAVSALRENLIKTGEVDINSMVNIAANLGIEIEGIEKLSELADAIYEVADAQSYFNMLDENDPMKTAAATLLRVAQEKVDSLLNPETIKTIDAAAQGIEDRLQENIISEKTAKAKQAILKEENAILKDNLQTTRKINQLENSRLNTTTRFDSILKSATALTQSLEDTEMKRQEAANNLAAITQKDTELRAQLGRAQAEFDAQETEANQRTIDYLNAQISANETLAQTQRDRIKNELNNVLKIQTARAQDLAFRTEAAQMGLRATDSLIAQVDLTQQTEEQAQLLLAAEEARIAAQDRLIKQKREEFDLQNKINAANRANVQAGRERFAQRLGLGSMPERFAETENLQARLDVIDGQKALLEQEKQAALSKINLEEQVFMVRMAAAKLELRNAITNADISTPEGLAARNEAQTALDSLSGLNLNDFARDFEEQRNGITETFRLRGELLAEERTGVEQALAGVIQGAAGIKEQIIAQMQLGTAFNIGTFGLEGQAREFVAQETTGILADKTMTDEEKAAAIDQARAMGSEIQTAQMFADGLSNIMDTVASSTEAAFMAMIDGSKSAKEAFADMAKAILKQIAQMIIKMLVFKAIEMGLNAIAPGFGTMMVGGANASGATGSGGVASSTKAKIKSKGAAGGIMGYADGGIIKPRDGLQGVVKRPTYLVGEGRYNEAVVPLPNGRAIPVQMHGGQSSQQNNVSVSVNVDSNGSASTTTSGDYQDLGAIIGQAVQKELIAQKMPGGILNRYGAA